MTVSLKPAYVPVLVSLLKTDVDHFLSVYGQREDFHLVLKELRETDPYFAKTLTDVCHKLMRQNSDLLKQLIDTCDPYERNIFFSHLISHSSYTQKISLAVFLAPEITVFLDIWKTLFPNEVTFKTLDNIAQSCDDHSTDRLVQVLSIPIIREALLSNIRNVHLHIVGHLFKRSDPETQFSILKSRDISEIPFLIIKLENCDLLSFYLPSLGLSDFIKLYDGIHWFSLSNRRLALMQHCSDAQFEYLKQLPEINADVSHVDIQSFVRNTSATRKRKIIALFSDITTYSFENLHRIPAYLFLITDLDNEYFSGTRSHWFSIDQLKFLAQHAKRSHIIALEEGLRTRDKNDWIESFYNSLPKESKDGYQATLEEFVETFNKRLTSYHENVVKAYQAFMQGDYDYKKVIKPLRKYYHIRSSNTFIKMGIVFKTDLPKKFASLTYENFLVLTAKISRLSFDGKDGAFHPVIPRKY